MYEKYQPLLWPDKKITFESFLLAMYKHQKHKNPDVVMVPTLSGSVGRDTQGVAKAMTELFARKVEGLKPEDVTAKDYVSVNKLVIEEKKLQLDKDAQMLMVAKLFGIQEPIKGNVVEGELDESGKLESSQQGEVTGNQQENP